MDWSIWNFAYLIYNNRVTAQHVRDQEKWYFHVMKYETYRLRYFYSSKQFKEIEIFLKFIYKDTLL